MLVSRIYNARLWRHLDHVPESYGMHRSKYSIAGELLRERKHPHLLLPIEISGL